LLNLYSTGLNFKLPAAVKAGFFNRSNRTIIIVMMRKFSALWPLLLAAAVLCAQAGPSPDREQGQVDAEPVWRRALGGEMTGLPTTQVQSVVAALDGGNIKAYSTAGTPLWSYSARGKINPFVTRSREGTSYISRNTGALIAVNRSGRELWRRTPGGPLSGPVVSGWDGRLFVPTGNKLTCYTASGNQLWSKNFEKRISVSPRLDQGGGVMLALENGETLRIDSFGKVWSWKLPGVPRVLVSLSPSPGTASTRIMALHQNGSMEILGNSEEWFRSADPGEAMSALPQLSSPPLAAASRGNLIAVTQRDGRTLLISPDEGKILWTGDSHIRINSIRGGSTEDEAVMLYDERGIYVLSRGGASGFTMDGRRLWFITLRNTAAIPAFGDDGVLYSGGKDWILYAYKVEDRSYSQQQSLYGPAPEGTYGTGSPPPLFQAEWLFRFEEQDLRARLDNMGKSILSGTVGENELGWTAYLMEAIAGEYNRPGSSLFHPAVNVQYRVQALRLLALIGSRETIPFLTTVFRNDVDPVIRAAAAEAIGGVGVDPDGVAIRAFLQAISPAVSFEDEQVLLAVASATGALCRFSGPPLADTGIKILNILSAGGRSGAVRQQARQELETLKL
jgi:outer membrane protein assembly factor BamB